MQNDYQVIASKLKSANPKVIDEILRQAELFLQAQLQTALASDQRSLVFASIIGGLIALFFGGVTTLLSAKIINFVEVYWIGPMIVCLLFSLLYALSSCRPIQFSSSGNNPRQWIEDVVSGQSLHDSKAETAMLYCKAIEDNTESMRKNGVALKIAFWWSLAALVVCLLGIIVAGNR